MVLDRILEMLTPGQAAAVRAGAAFAVAVAVSAWSGGALVRRFRRRGIVEDVSVPDSARLDRLRRSKKGTPTMGGIMILAGVAAAMACCAPAGRAAPVIIACAVMALYGALGLLDDGLKRRFGAAGVARRLTRKRKLAIEMVIALAAAAALYADAARAGGAAPGLLRVSGETGLDLGWAYVPLAALVIAATANAVNLTDGLDGLAAGCSLAAAAVPLAIGLGLVGAVEGDAPAEAARALAPLCAALMGALAGFLYYNRHPAKIFMGDTGSLAIGGVLGVVVVAAKLEALFLLFGSVFLLETASVALQVGWFKMTRRRLFRCAPFHHHLEFAGWPEVRVVNCFWAASIATAALALAAARM